jgi:hypothetical protein
MDTSNKSFSQCYFSKTMTITYSLNSSEIATIYEENFYFRIMKSNNFHGLNRIFFIHFVCKINLNTLKIVCEFPN